MNSIFFNFIKPFLNIIDNGRLFRKAFYWLYIVIAFINLLLPLILLIYAVSEHISGRYIFGFIVMWLALAGLFWFLFQLWWNRKDVVASISDNDDDFVAIPALSHFVQTSGEWYGLLIGVGGFIVMFVALIFMSGDSYYSPASYLMREILPFGDELGDIGFIGLLLFPVIGFLIIITNRFLAELMRAFTSIANNTNPKKNNRSAAVKIQNTLQSSKLKDDKSKIEELKQLKELFDSGAITKEEFEQQKNHLL